MADAELDVVGVGNAIVDVLAEADDAFIVEQNLNKGAMALIDAQQAEALYERMGPGTEMSGGSAANTIAGLASLGGKAGFIGKVRDDQLGAVFRHDIRALGVEFATAPMTAGPPTARCLILITPDAQRTMNTFLGACVELTEDDIDEALIGRAQITYLEGYLFDPPAAKRAFAKAAAAAHAAGRKVSLTLSDTFCVERHREEFQDLVANHIDILFANENEAKALYRKDDFNDAVAAVRGNCEIVCVTRSEKGSIILAGDQSHEIPAERPERLVDTTGAGDLYAAGVLYGLTQGRPLPDCGRIGSLAAAEAISHVGARPVARLADVVAARMGGY